MLKKIILVILLGNLLFFSLFSPFVRTASAQTWFNQDFFDWYTKVYDTTATPAEEIYGERYTAAQVQWVIYGIWAFFINGFLQSDVVACIFGNWTDPPALVDCLVNSVFLQFVEGIRDLIRNAIGYENGDYYTKPAYAMVWETRPLSGIGYVRERFNITPEVRAQGFGFEQLEIIQPIWRASRNVAFFFLVLAVVVMSFMIMFRVKIAPQTVISVQSAIPKIIVGIILISFSYAIAGFMIDLVYVTIGVLASLFAQAFGVSFGPAQASGIYYRFMTEGLPGIGLGIWGLLTIYMPLFFITFFVALVIMMGVLNIIPIVFLNNILMTFIITFLIGILLIIVSFRIIWMLIKTLVNVLLLVIAGPLFIMGGVVTPSAGFGNWLKALASNLAIYPLTGAMIVLAYLFLLWGMAGALAGANPILNAIETAFEWFGVDLSIAPNTWTPPLTFNPPPGGSSAGIIFTFVSLSTLFLIPKLADILKALISGRPFAYGTAIGEALGPIAAGAGLGWGVANQAQMGHYAGLEAQLKKGTIKEIPLLYRSINTLASALRGARGGRR